MHGYFGVHISKFLYVVLKHATEKFFIYADIFPKWHFVHLWNIIIWILILTLRTSHIHISLILLTLTSTAMYNKYYHLLPHKFYIFLFYVNECFSCMHAYHMPAWYVQRPEEYIKFPRIAVIDHFDPPCSFLCMNNNSSTAEPSLP